MVLLETSSETFGCFCLAQDEAQKWTFFVDYFSLKISVSLAGWMG
jgi:hypothetical protein